MPPEKPRKFPFLKMGNLPHVRTFAAPYDDLTTNFEVRQL